MDETVVNQNEVVNETDIGEKTEDVKELLEKLKKAESENDKLRKSVSAACSEAADWKKQFRATQDEATRAEAERNEILEQIKAENAQLKKEQTLAQQTSGFLELGMDAETAKMAAEATVDQNFGDLLSAFKTFLAAHDKALNAEAIKNTPSPASGKTSPGLTKEEFNKMGLRELNELYAKDPELYNSFMK